MFHQLSEYWQCQIELIGATYHHVHELKQAIDQGCRENLSIYVKQFCFLWKCCQLCLFTKLRLCSHRQIMCVLICEYTILYVYIYIYIWWFNHEGWCEYRLLCVCWAVVDEKDFSGGVCAVTKIWPSGYQWVKARELNSIYLRTEYDPENTMLFSHNNNNHTYQS